MTIGPTESLDSHILGFTLWEAGYSSGLGTMPTDDLDTVVRSIGLAPYPHLVAHAAWHLEPSRPRHAPEFEFGLDLILDGVTAAAPPRRPSFSRPRTASTEAKPRGSASISTSTSR